MSRAGIAKVNKEGRFKFFSNNLLNMIYVFEEDFAVFKILELWRYVIFLDDHCFKKQKVTRFERILRSYYHAYYFNHNTGLHYDQFEVFRNKKRILFSCPYELGLKKIKLEKNHIHLPPFHARSGDLYGLEGDFLSKKNDFLDELVGR